VDGVRPRLLWEGGVVWTRDLQEAREQAGGRGLGDTMLMWFSPYQGRGDDEENQMADLASAV